MKPAWPTELVPGKTGLQRETLSQIPILLLLLIIIIISSRIKESRTSHNENVMQKHNARM